MLVKSCCPVVITLGVHGLSTPAVHTHRLGLIRDLILCMMILIPCDTRMLRPLSHLPMLPGVQGEYSYARLIAH